MTTTVSNAVELANKTAALVTQYEDRFTRILPAHLPTDTFMGLALAAIRRQDVAEATARDPLSLIAALTNCARLGHQPGTEAFYLVAVGGKVEGWEGYRGVVERIYRAGGVSSIHGAVVRANDVYEYEEGMPHPIHRHKRFASAAERGERIGSFCYARLRDGGYSKVIEMSAEDIAKHKDMNRSSGGASSPWMKWTDSMWLKVPARELEKWVPSSAEYRQQMAMANIAAAQVAAEESLPAPTGDYIDGDVVWPAAAQPGGAE